MNTASAEAKMLHELKEIVQELNPAHTPKNKTRFVYAPRSGGEYFIPIDFKVIDGRKPAIKQADINAAINVGLRAIAKPGTFSISHRVRTTKEGKVLKINEKRVFNHKDKPLVTIQAINSDEENQSNSPNLFIDVAKVVTWGHASSPGLEGDNFVLATALFKHIKDEEWNIAMQLARAARYKYDTITGL
jgi:hypothetical protein